MNQNGIRIYSKINQIFFQVFHICLPIEDNEGQVIETAKWSFFCGNATVFDQQTLTCNYPENAFPCEESPSLYGSVEFGKIPDDYQTTFALIDTCSECSTVTAEIKLCETTVLDMKNLLMKPRS